MDIATAPAQQTRNVSSGWLAIAQVSAIAGILIALYAAPVADMAQEWWTEPQASHGLLIPPLALYIAYMRRKLTFAVPARMEMRGLWLTALGCFLFLAGRLAAEFFLTRISLVVVLAGTAQTFWGTRRLRTLALPFVLLATMVPLPVILYNSLAAPLQLLASTIATNLAQQLGISIFREGNIIHLASTSLGVAEACSGLHSLSALVVGSLLLGFLENGGTGGRILLVLLSLPLAVAVNVVRVTGTAILADIQPDYAMGFYHMFSGWLVFIVGFGVLWAMARWMFRSRREESR